MSDTESFRPSSAWYSRKTSKASSSSSRSQLHSLITILKVGSLMPPQSGFVEGLHTRKASTRRAQAGMGHSWSPRGSSQRPGSHFIKSCQTKGRTQRGHRANNQGALEQQKARQNLDGEWRNFSFIYSKKVTLSSYKIKIKSSQTLSNESKSLRLRYPRGGQESNTARRSAQGGSCVHGESIGLRKSFQALAFEEDLKCKWISRDTSGQRLIPQARQLPPPD